MRTVEEALFLAEVLPAQECVLKPRREHRALFNFRGIVMRHLESIGGSMDSVVVGLFQLLWQHAKEGDMIAIKILLDRICGKDAEHVEIAVANLSDTERAARIEAILEAARGRSSNGNGHVSRITVDN